MPRYVRIALTSFQGLTRVSPKPSSLLVERVTWGWPAVHDVTTRGWVIVRLALVRSSPEWARGFDTGKLLSNAPIVCVKHISELILPDGATKTIKNTFALWHWQCTTHVKCKIICTAYGREIISDSWQWVICFTFQFNYPHTTIVDLWVQPLCKISSEGVLARSEISRFGFDVSDSILCSPKENAALLVVGELICMAWGMGREAVDLLLAGCVCHSPAFSKTSRVYCSKPALFREPRTLPQKRFYTWFSTNYIFIVIVYKTCLN